jgi:hypothetical protein
LTAGAFSVTDRNNDIETFNGELCLDEGKTDRAQR